MRELVDNYQDVMENVRAFNQGLGTDNELEWLIPFFRAWYYIPELDMVGPSKFIGYKGMTESEYMNAENLDGRETEPVLNRWFDVMSPHSSEEHYIENIVQALAGRYRKTVNRKARFNAPRDWGIIQNKNHVQTPETENQNVSNYESPMVEVIWRAFLALPARDQMILFRRIRETRDIER